MRILVDHNTIIYDDSLIYFKSPKIYSAFCFIILLFTIFLSFTLNYNNVYIKSMTCFTLIKD